MSEMAKEMCQNVLPVEDYFPLPNAIFNLRLSAEEIAIYAFLMHCEDRRTFTCYPSLKTIGRAVGKSKNTVLKYVKMLEEKQLVSIDRTFVITKRGARNGNLKFTIKPIQDAMDEFYSHQLRKPNNIPCNKSRKRKKNR